MKTYVIVFMPFETEIKVEAVSPDQAKKKAWESLTDAEKNSVAYIEVIDIL